MSKKDLPSGLTDEQKKAVTHTDGPMLVVAGAGTGKTTVIAKRIAHLIVSKLAKPQEILALTFTEKAAAEMTVRVDEISDWVYADLSISTFHSFGSDIISEFSFELGLPADFKVLTDVEQILFIRDHIFDFTFRHFQNLSEPTSLIKELVKTFSRIKDERLTSKDCVLLAERNLKKAETEAEKEEAEKDLEIAHAFSLYNDLLRKEGYIDYGDQINLVVDLLLKPSIAEKLKKRYKYVLVDEFQDTNRAQNELILKLFGKNGNVMVVGDDDQSIFAFRGTSVSNILEFKENFSNVKTVVLLDNFRSTQPILDAAYKLIQNNNPYRLEAKYDIVKKLVSKKGKGEEPKLLLFETESQEAEAVAEKIKELKKAGTDFSDMAVLFRANRHAEEFVRTFKKKGIPFVFSGAAGLYEKMEVKMLISLISALSCPEDDLALYHLSLSDVYDMNADDAAKITHYASRHNIPLYKAFSDIPSLVSPLGLTKETAKKAKEIIENLSHLREEAKDSTAGEIVNLFLRSSGYYARLTKEARDGSLEATNKISNIAAFFDKIIHFQRNYKDHSLKKFSEYLKLVLDAGDDPKPFEPEDGFSAVSLLSIHKAKGLEFDAVFVSSLSDSHIPGRNFTRNLLVSSDFLPKGPAEDASINEERRLFYVALTRAKKHLYLTAALDYGTKKTHKLSRFVVETLGEKAAPKRFLKTEPIEKIKHFEKVESLYTISFKPIPKDKKIVLSRAQIDDFLTCPFKFQLIHITPIRIISDANIAYGNTIHNTIAEYFNLRMKGKKVSKEKLMELYDLFWNDAGFLSKVHEEKRYETGKKALAAFYKKAEKDSLPLFIEKDFKFSVGNTIIRGRYDAVYKDKEKVRIVDFKTSNIKNQKQADERTKKSTQLASYAYSWMEREGKLPETVELYFIESGYVGSYVPTSKSAQNTKEEIEKAASGIRKRDFSATPSLNNCRYCPFKYYCPEAYLEKVSS